MTMAPLHVEVYVNKKDQYVCETQVGNNGGRYKLTMVDVINLCRKRCGWQQARLEYRR